MSRIGAAFRFEIGELIKRRLSEFDVLEVMVDHYLAVNNHKKQVIRDFAAEVPVVGHGIGLSLGTYVKPDPRYLERVARSLDEMGALYHSEHLAFTRVPGIEYGELLPLPRTREMAEHVISNIRYVKSFLNIPFHLENISYYFEYPDSELSDAEFFSLVCRESGAGALLDVENVYVNSMNHGGDPKGFIDALPVGVVGAMHIAGGEWRDGVFVDTHGSAVPDEALELMVHALQRHKPDVIILERDGNLSDGEELISDLRRVRAFANQMEAAVA